MAAMGTASVFSGSLSEESTVASKTEPNSHLLGWRREILLRENQG
jgi:hypothetical protein